MINTDDSPGPRRHHDPLIEAQARRAHALKSRPSSKSRLMSGSNPSLESQLANDFRQRANLASPSASSLGRLGSSSMNLHDPPNFAGLAGSPSNTSYSFLDPRLAVQGHGQGSAPTSPYGQPQGKAVALGHGIGRQHPYEHANGQASGERLPGFDGDGDGYINPMFRVVSDKPVSDIDARLMDSHLCRTRRDRLCRRSRLSRISLTSRGMASGRTCSICAFIR